MKKLPLILLLIFFWILKAQASEITGDISTDPNKITNQTVPVPSATSSEINTEEVKSGGSTPLYILLAQNKKPAGTTAETVKVLGVIRYPDNSLLRGSDKKVYAVAGRYKKLIRSLAELNRYRGQKIEEVDDATLGQYVSPDLQWQLVKAKDSPKVYVIKDNRKIWIPNMAELRRYFSGQKIIEISAGEMKLF